MNIICGYQRPKQFFISSSFAVLIIFLLSYCLIAINPPDALAREWGRCPVCGSSNIDDGDWGDEAGNWDPTIWGCYRCGARWTDYGSLIWGGSDPSSPNVSFPGWDPTQCPGEGYEWRGTGAVGSNEGSWYRESDRTYWWPDLEHPEPIGAHWDYRDSSGNMWRFYPSGRVEFKSWGKDDIDESEIA